MNILIVECDGERAVHSHHVHNLAAEGHSLRVALNHGEALALAGQDWAELVLMNASSPNHYSPEIVLQVKNCINGQRFVPVVFLSPELDDPALARFIENYADDFIESSHNHQALKAKIAVIERTLQVHDSLQKFKQKTEFEIGMAKRIFDKLMNRAQASCANVQHWVWAAGHFSGDVLFYERTPQGGINVMLGDFTSHGLAAAIGAVPASDAFFSMTRKGRKIGKIAAEINNKLHRFMPTGHFCAACLVGINPARASIEIWNGGLPQVLVVDDDHRVIAGIRSAKPALGVMSAEEFDASTEVLAVPSSCHLVMYSDGLTEAVNPHGEMFGDARLQTAINEAQEPAHTLESIKSCLIAFMEGLEPIDDVSLVTLTTG
ncbi:MAG: SpoIIE family protein phosphatase [Sulfuricella sp.]|nr:SpoIIE family protein phosphatase [Sulfuricella sp.]